LELIHAPKATFDITAMCDLLKVSRSGHYKWAQGQAAGPSPRTQRRNNPLVTIRKLHDDSDGVNRAPRITADVRDDGEVVSTKTVAKLMHTDGLQDISPRPRRPVTTLADQVPHTIPDRGRAGLRPRRTERGGVAPSQSHIAVALSHGLWVVILAYPPRFVQPRLVIWAFRLLDGHCCECSQNRVVAKL
jgi:hypothetical protein